mgnify:CR=1 FL=1
MINGDRWSKKGKYRGYKTEASLKRLMDYVTDKKKTEEHLISGKGCSPGQAYESFLLNKEIWGKGENGKRRMCIHFTQSFGADEAVTPELAHRIAGELAESDYFAGFQILYATHIDRDHIHTHFVVDTVNTETGKMWHISKDELESKIKDVSDAIIQKYGLEVCKKSDRPKAWKNQGEDRTVEKQASWKEEIRIAVTLAAETAESREEFMNILKDMNITCDWQDNHKYIVFMDEAGHRVRHNRLSPPELFTKEALTEQFRLNRQYAAMQTAEAARSDAMLSGGVNAVLRLAKDLARTGQEYPMQQHDLLQALSRAKSAEARKQQAAEEKKGRGIW